MNRWRNRQAIVQAVLTAALLAALWAVFPAKPQPADAPLGAFDHPASGSAASENGNADSSFGVGDDLRTMPAYREAQRSVGELNSARAALLKAAASTDGAATRLAAENYRRSLAQVRSALATLQAHVDPAEFPQSLQELLGPQAEAELGAEATQESLLGTLPGVSPLTKESLP